MTHRNLLLVLLCTVTAVFTRAGCPNQCYHQGACTRGLCNCYRSAKTLGPLEDSCGARRLAQPVVECPERPNCYRGYAGADCVHELEHEGSGMPAYSDLVTLPSLLSPNPLLARP